MTRMFAAGEVGASAPDCSLTSFGSAEPFQSKSFTGQLVYIDFWASWCGPCAKSFPFMNELHRKYNEKGLKIIGVNLDENADDAKAFLQKIPADFAIASDPNGQCAQKFDVKAMPSSYIIGRDGKIRFVQLGFRSGESEETDERIAQLLKEGSTADLTAPAR